MTYVEDRLEPDGSDFLVEQDTDTDWLYEVIDDGVDRLEVESSYKAYRKRHPKGELTAMAVYDHLQFYVDAADDAAKEAHEILTEENRGLIFHIVNQYDRAVETDREDDLVQEAWAALSLSIWRHDTARGTLASHAIPDMRKQINLYLASNDHAVKIPVDVYDRTRSLRRQLGTEFDHAVQTNDSDGILADKLGNTDLEILPRVIRFISMFRYVRSLDESFGQRNAYFDYDGQPTHRGIRNDISDQLPSDSHQRMEDEVEWAIDAINVTDQALALLDERERRIIELRFGLFDGKIYTLSEAGEVFGIKSERTRQIEAKAIAKIRGTLGRNYISDEPVDNDNTPKSLSGGVLEPYVEDKDPRKENIWQYYRENLSRYHAWGDYLNERGSDLERVCLTAATAIFEGIAPPDVSKDEVVRKLEEVADRIKDTLIEQHLVSSSQISGNLPVLNWILKEDKIQRALAPIIAKEKESLKRKGLQSAV